MQMLDRIADLVGLFWGVGAAPPAGAKSFTLTGDMPAGQVSDPTNYVRLQVWADFGAGPKWMKRGGEWHGGPGQTPPALTWDFDPAHAPLLVYGVLENGTRGAGSPAVCGLTGTFN